MSKEQRRRNPSLMTEISLESMLSGEILNPFTPAEIKYLEVLRDGFDDAEEIAKHMGIKPASVKERKRLIVDKMRQFVNIEGADMQARALTMSIMAGWTDTSFSASSRRLEPDEFSMLFFICFGNSKKQVQAMLHVSEEDFEHKFEQIKEAVGATGYYQVLAWGASRAKIYLENRASNGRSTENA